MKCIKFSMAAVCAVVLAAMPVQADVYDLSLLEGALVINTPGPHVIHGSLTNSMNGTTNVIVSYSGKVNVTLSNSVLQMTYNPVSAMVVTNGADLTLTLVGTNRWTGFNMRQSAIFVYPDCSLTIQEEGHGVLIATGGLRGAGIGATDSTYTLQHGPITILSGDVQATGGNEGAGIGGGYNSSGGPVRIAGGTVAAMGGNGAAGIGGGGSSGAANYARAGGDVVITGGSVFAKARSRANAYTKPMDIGWGEGSEDPGTLTDGGVPVSNQVYLAELPNVFDGVHEAVVHVELPDGGAYQYLGLGNFTNGVLVSSSAYIYLPEGLYTNCYAGTNHYRIYVNAGFSPTTTVTRLGDASGVTVDRVPVEVGGGSGWTNLSTGAEHQVVFTNSGAYLLRDYIDAAGVSFTVASGVEAEVTLKSFNLTGATDSSAFTVESGATLAFALLGDSRLAPGSGGNIAVAVSPGAVFRVMPEQAGRLYVSGDGGPGIGGMTSDDAGTVEILGGLVALDDGDGIVAATNMIIGASLKTTVMEPLPVNGDGAPVYLVTLDGQTPNAVVSLDGLAGYGSILPTDENGILYLHLSDGDYAFAADGVMYAVSVNGSATNAALSSGLWINGVDAGNTFGSGWTFDGVTLNLNASHVYTLTTRGTTKSNLAVKMIATIVVFSNFHAIAATEQPLLDMPSGGVIRFAGDNSLIGQSSYVVGAGALTGWALQGAFDARLKVSGPTNGFQGLDSPDFILYAGTVVVDVPGTAFAGNSAGFYVQGGTLEIKNGIIDESNIRISGGSIKNPGFTSTPQVQAAALDVFEVVLPKTTNLTVTGTLDDSTPYTYTYEGPGHDGDGSIYVYLPNGTYETDSLLIDVTGGVATVSPKVFLGRTINGRDAAYGSGPGWWVDNGTIQILADGDYVLSGDDPEAGGMALGVQIAEGISANLILSNFVVAAEAAGGALDIPSGASVDLLVLGTNRLDASAVSGVPGIHVPQGAALNVLAESTGILTAKGTAAIGSVNGKHAGAISIGGATIFAEETIGQTTAGIGASITISGGSVWADSLSPMPFNTSNARVYATVLAGLPANAEISFDGLEAIYHAKNLWTDDSGRLCLYLPVGTHMASTDGTNYLFRVATNQTEAAAYTAGVKVNGQDVGLAADFSGPGWTNIYSNLTSTVVLSGEGPFVITSEGLPTTNVYLHVPEGVTNRVVFSNLFSRTLEGGFVLSSNAMVHLTISGVNSLNAILTATQGARLQVPPTATLVIDAASVAAGQLRVINMSSSDAAAIGGLPGEGYGTIIISNGYVHARSPTGGAAIGGGKESLAEGLVEIHGGLVYAQVDEQKGVAGIGGGTNGTHGAFLMTGGSLETVSVGPGRDGANGGQQVVTGGHFAWSPATTTIMGSNTLSAADGSGTSVYRVYFGWPMYRTNVVVTGLGSYGVNDIITTHAFVSFYLPNGNYFFEVDGTEYVANVNGQNTWAYQPSAVKVNGENIGRGFGTGWTNHYVDGDSVRQVEIFGGEASHFVITSEGVEALDVSFLINTNCSLQLNDALLNLVALDGANALSLGDGKSVSLTMNGSNTLVAGAGAAGIYVPATATLTVGTNWGSLATVVGGANAAGIGGNGGESAGTLIFNAGAALNVLGGENAAAIGGGSGGSVAQIQVDGGWLIAQGGENAAGLGGGSMGTAGRITIANGTVWASGGSGGDDIGGGASAENTGVMQFTGGSIRAASKAITPAPTNAAGEALYCVLVPFGYADMDVSVDSLESSMDGYGCRDLRTDAEGNLYFYLPSGEYHFQVRANLQRNPYYADVRDEDTRAFPPVRVRMNDVDIGFGGGVGWAYEAATATLLVTSTVPASTYLLTGSNDAVRVVVDSSMVDQNLTVSNLYLRSTNGSALRLASGAELNLHLLASNQFAAAAGYAAVHVPEGSTLDVYAGQTGFLHATGGASSAAIGGGSNQVCGSIHLNSGTIVASAGTDALYAIGVGADVASVSGDVRITGGNIWLENGGILPAPLNSESLAVYRTFVRLSGAANQSLSAFSVTTNRSSYPYAYAGMRTVGDVGYLSVYLPASTRVTSTVNSVSTYSGVVDVSNASWLKMTQAPLAFSNQTALLTTKVYADTFEVSAAGGSTGSNLVYGSLVPTVAVVDGDSGAGVVLGAGTFQATAEMAGNEIYWPVALTSSVITAQARVVGTPLIVSPTSGSSLQNVTLSTVLTNVPGNIGTNGVVAPTGSVTFTATGLSATNVAVVEVDGEYVASVTLPSNVLTQTKYSFTATYVPAADETSRYAAASASSVNNYVIIQPAPVIFDQTANVKYLAAASTVTPGLKALITAQTTAAGAAIASVAWSGEPASIYDANGALTATVTYAENYSLANTNVTVAYTVLYPSLYLPANLASIRSTNAHNVDADALLAYANTERTLAVSAGQTAYQAALGTEPVYTLPVFSWADSAGSYAQTGGVYRFTKDYLSTTHTRTVTVDTVRSQAPVVPVASYVDETLATTASMQYRTNTTEAWLDCGTTTLPIQESWFGANIYFRNPVSGYYIESLSQTVSVPARPVVPSTPAQGWLADSTTNQITLRTVTGVEYGGGDPVVWQDSALFSSLEPDVYYTFNMRVKASESAHNFHGVAATVSLTTKAIAPVFTNTATQVKYSAAQAGVLPGLHALITNQVSPSIATNFVWDAAPSVFTNAGTLSCQITLTDHYMPSTASASVDYSVVIPVLRPTQPSFTISATNLNNASADALLAYVNNNLGLSPDVSGEYAAALGTTPTYAMPAYLWSQSAQTYAPTGGVYTFTQSYLDNTLSKTATVSGVRSTLPAVAIDYEAETLSTAQTMLYSLDQAAWSVCNTDALAIGPAWFGTNLYFKNPAATIYMMESGVQTLVVPVRPPAPDAAGVQEATTDSITLIQVTGCEYATGSPLVWQDATLFTGLEEETEYAFAVRVKADNTAKHFTGIATNFNGQTLAIQIFIQCVSIADIRFADDTVSMVVGIDGEDGLPDGLDTEDIWSATLLEGDPAHWNWEPGAASVTDNEDGTYTITFDATDYRIISIGKPAYMAE